MKNYINKDFLLQNDYAKHLYHNHAEKMPIIDFHCHLDPKEINENKKFSNITEIWLGGDHYKWRAMRSNGISEKFMTGEADDYEKFSKWVETVPYTIGNPLYQWSHLELKRYFDISVLINNDSRDEIWDNANEIIRSDSFSTQNILKKFDVEIVITTDDPVDNLESHKDSKDNKQIGTKVLPGFRPDNALNLNNSNFKEWVNKLSISSEIVINNYSDYIKALYNRIDYFNKMGCKLSDHALDEVVYEENTIDEVSRIFKKAINDEFLDKTEISKFKTRTLINLAKKYKEVNWIMQYHIGALRNNNSKMFKKLGPDVGYDSINDIEIANSLSKLLDKINTQFGLPKTILYNLNPSDNEVIATMIGNFQDGKIPGKIQMGSAWWFLDQKTGIEKQLTSLANMGLLSRFVGMVTDSRSFLSFTRHEYFRRVLCNLIGDWVEKGEIPWDKELLGNMVENICYYNAKKYFEFDY